MRTLLTRAFSTCAITACCCLSSSAFAVSSVTAVPCPDTARQIGASANALAAVCVYGQSSTAVLTLGGGFTLRCEGSSSNYRIQNSRAFRNGEGTRGVEKRWGIPSENGGSYEIAGFSSWKLNEPHLCTFEYIGVSSDVAVGSIGRGADLVLRPGGDPDRRGDTKTFNMTKKSNSNPCSVSNPETTTLSLDGTVKNLGKGQAQSLTEIGIAEDGRPIVQDRAAVEKRNGAPVLVVQHQGTHPPNHNYTPTPELQFSRQTITLAPEASRRGWALLSFGESGRLRDIRVLAADDGNVAKNHRNTIAKAVTTAFLDHRRHDHTAYVAFVVEHGALNILGGVVTTPRCCGGGCPPRPYVCD